MGGHSFKGLDPLKYIHDIGFVKLFALLQFVYIMFSHGLYFEKGAFQMDLSRKNLNFLPIQSLRRLAISANERLQSLCKDCLQLLCTNRLQ